MRKYLLLIPFLLFAGKYGVITGKVVDSKTGEPVGGTLVVVEELYHGATTNENGEYTLPFISAGTYTVSVTHWRYISKKYNNVVINANDTTILNISLDYGPPPIIVSSHYPTYQYEFGMIKGKVIDGITCNPISNVDIVIEKIAFDTLGQPILTIMNRSTNQNGEYSLDSVPVGTYKLTARMIGYQNYIHEKVIVRKNEKTGFDFSMFRYDTAGGEIQTVDELQCIVYSKKQTYYPGEPFIIVCTIRNLTKKPIRLCKYSDHGGAILEFSKVDSSVVCNIATLRGLCSFGQTPGKDDFVVITKANSFIREFDYTDMIHEPGRYEYSIDLVFKQTGSEYGFNAWTGSLESNTINFEVKAVIDIKVELDKKISVWSRYVADNPYLSTLTTNKYFQDIVDLGVPVLPYMIERMEGGCLILGYAVGKITKKLFTPSEYKDTKSIGDYRVRAEMYIQWWKEGRKKTPQQFDSLYNEWYQFKESGDNEKAGEVYMNICRLGIIALPFIIEKIENGDIALIPLIAMLTTGEIKRDATIKECVDWWYKHKEKWYLPIEDESKEE